MAFARSGFAGFGFVQKAKIRCSRPYLLLLRHRLQFPSSDFAKTMEDESLAL